MILLLFFFLIFLVVSFTLVFPRLGFNFWGTHGVRLSEREFDGPIGPAGLGLRLHLNELYQKQKQMTEGVHSTGESPTRVLRSGVT